MDRASAACWRAALFARSPHVTSTPIIMEKPLEDITPVAKARGTFSGLHQKFVHLFEVDLPSRREISGDNGGLSQGKLCRLDPLTAA
jgi:hypothetical protein